MYFISRPYCHLLGWGCVDVLMRWELMLNTMGFGLWAMLIHHRNKVEEHDQIIAVQEGDHG